MIREDERVLYEDEKLYDEVIQDGIIATLILRQVLFKLRVIPFVDEHNKRVPTRLKIRTFVQRFFNGW
jgi:hypothetical protein